MSINVGWPMVETKKSVSLWSVLNWFRVREVVVTGLLVAEVVTNGYWMTEICFVTLVRFG